MKLTFDFKEEDWVYLNDLFDRVQTLVKEAGGEEPGGSFHQRQVPALRRQTKAITCIDTEIQQLVQKMEEACVVNLGAETVIKKLQRIKSLLLDS